MDFPILIIWMSPLSLLGATGVIFSFLFHFSMKIKLANRKAPDGLFILPMSHQNEARLIWVTVVRGWLVE